MEGITFASSVSVKLVFEIAHAGVKSYNRNYNQSNGCVTKVIVFGITSNLGSCGSKKTDMERCMKYLKISMQTKNNKVNQSKRKLFNDNNHAALFLK